MSCREWKPGDVALLQPGTGAERIGLRFEDGWRTVGGMMSDVSDPARSSHRPLVVIDPESFSDITLLAQEYLIAKNDYVGQSLEFLTRPLQAALREFANPTPPKRVWTDGDVVLVWNNHERAGVAIVLSRHGGEWLTPTGSGWDVESVEDALASRGTQHFRCGEVLREQAAEVTA